MPKTIKHAEPCIVIMKMHLEIMRLFCRAYFNQTRFGSCTSDMALLGAILVGQAEGRAMNSSKLAEFAGIPRGTVIRRLSILIKKGIVERHGDAFEIHAPIINSAQATAAAVSARKVIVDAAAKLSRMDTLAIAKSKAAKLSGVSVIFSESLEILVSGGVFLTRLHGT